MGAQIRVLSIITEQILLPSVIQKSLKNQEFNINPSNEDIAKQMEEAIKNLEESQIKRETDTKEYQNKEVERWQMQQSLPSAK